MALARRKRKTMNEQETSKFYYLVDAVVGDPQGASDVLEGETREGDSRDASYKRAVEELTKLIGAKHPSGLEQFGKIAKHLVQTNDPIKQEIGRALKWAVLNHSWPSRAPQIADEAQATTGEIDLLKMI